MALSSSSLNWVYDVFPSFSGEDVRVTFLSHFLKELERKLITAFKDNEIVRSRSLDPELKQAIKDSRIAVVVFSINYASSSWCLNELLEILKCKEEFGQMVIPVFYGLDPSHVRKQTGDFGKIFQETCKNKTEEVINQWKKALNDVANILGYHSASRDNEAKMIEEIANDVLDKLLLTTSKDYEDFVGIEDHIRKMSVLLCLESEEVRMVGIWGSSGIGKTIIARALFNRLSRHFKGSLFIDRAFVSKSTEIYSKANPDDYNMKLHLQENFLSEIMGKRDIKIDHLGALEERLKHQKILIFIDDLDDQMVLDSLVGKVQWFGSGSRIIVVTNDKHLLVAHGIDCIYEVCLPSEKLALEMLCRSAFRRNSPPKGFENLVVEVAKHVGSLPLGLNVLGSSLRGRDMEYWMDILLRLENSIDGKIEKTLRVSYDGLGSKEDKAIFRHVACLFNHVSVTDIKLLLADSNLSVNIVLKHLADKSLIGLCDFVKMHNLLQEMGRNIVRLDDPEKREFLLDSEDICDVLTENIGTQKILGILLDLDEIDELHVHESAFKGMRNLRFLEIYSKTKGNRYIFGKKGKLQLPKSFDYLPSKLKLLCWPDYPMRCMPSKFRPENLVKFNMEESKLEKLWEGVVSLTCLKEVNLSGSHNLKEIPDLSMAYNLESLYLMNCWSLVELPSSIGNLNKLIYLNMRFCKNLETLPTAINLKSLQSLDLDGCLRLRTFPQISTNISKLLLDKTAIQVFPSNLPLENLVELRMAYLKNEKRWEGVLPLIHPIIKMLFPPLTSLWLSDIPNLVELPSSVKSLHKLTHLSIINCLNLESLPTSVNLESLTFLDLSGCSRLRSFPDISTNISRLYLDQTGIEEVPWWIKNFSKLIAIKMNKCKRLKYVSLNISKLKHLEKAEFSYCEALTEASWNDSTSEVAMSTVNIHSKLLVPHEASSSLPDDSFSVVKLSFMYCFNFDKESLFQQRSILFKSMQFSGEKVPSYFTHYTTGTSLTNISLPHRSPSDLSFRFKACAMVDSEAIPTVYSYICIQLCCRFKDRLGNNFDSHHRPEYYTIHEKGGHLFIFDCLFPLKKENDLRAEVNYEHVDIKFRFIFVGLGKLRGWGIRIIDNCETDKSEACEDSF